MFISVLIEKALSPATRDRILAHPEFRTTAEAIAARGLAHTEEQDEATRWLTKDLGRVSLYISALIIEAALGKVSVYDLLTAAKMNGTCSRARVLAFVQYARECGRLEVLPGDGHWTKRPLRFTPAFTGFARTRTWGEMEVAARILPEARTAMVLRGDARAFRAILVAAGQALTLRRDAFQAEELKLQPFLTREGGMRLLNELIGRQSVGRQSFLENAVISRRDIARKLGVSRVHINTLLNDAQSQGLLQLSAPERVTFSPDFSTRVEQHFAFVIQMNLLYALAALGACDALSHAESMSA